MKPNPIIIRKAPGGAGRAARVAIPGVLPSASRFGEQVVKLRVPSLDTYIGGGIPIGSICVIRDEFPSKFGDMVLKSFIADGASHNHRLYIATGHIDPQSFAKDLPSLKKNSNDGPPKSLMGDQEDLSAPDLKIAWRYGQQQGVGSSGGGGPPPKLGDQHNYPSFDFSKKCSVEDLGGKHVQYCKSCWSSGGVGEGDGTYKLANVSAVDRGNGILSEIMDAVQDLELEQTKPPANILRIAISHLEEEVASGQFLLKLRSIVKHTNSCVVIVMSDALCRNQSVSSMALARVEHLADVVITLQTVVDQKRRNELGGIDGVCDVLKLASNNTMKIVEAPKDIGFSFKKKRLIFHELHLPPEGETTTQRESSLSSSRNTGALQGSSSSCGANLQGKRIDF